MISSLPKISSPLTITDPPSRRFSPAASPPQAPSPPPMQPPTYSSSIIYSVARSLPPMISSLLTRSKPPTRDLLPLVISSPSLTCSRSPRRPRSPPCSPSPTLYQGDSLPPPPATAAALLLHLSDLCFTTTSAPLLLRRVPRHLHPRPRKKEMDDSPSPPPSPSVAPSASLLSTRTASLSLCRSVRFFALYQNCLPVTGHQKPQGPPFIAFLAGCHDPRREGR